MTKSEIEETLNMYGWGRWAIVHYARMFGAKSILGQIALVGYRETPQSAGSQIEDDAAMEIDRAVASLPGDRDAEIMLLYYGYGERFGYRQVGRIVGMSKERVQDRISCGIDTIFHKISTTS